MVAMATASSRLRAACSVQLTTEYLLPSHPALNDPVPWPGTKQKKAGAVLTFSCSQLTAVMLETGKQVWKWCGRPRGAVASGTGPLVKVPCISFTDAQL